MKEGFTKEIFDKCIHNSCNNGPLITDTEVGEMMCGSCGMVLVEKIEETAPDYHGFTKENYMKNTRFGPKTSLALNDMGLSTVIKSQNNDSVGRRLSHKMSTTFYRLRKWDQNTKSQKNRKFTEPFTLLDGIRAKLGLPESVVEKSAHLYRKAVTKDLIRGRSRPVLISATIYAACRFTNTPRTLRDVALAANVNKKNLQKTYRLLVNALDLTLDTYNPINFITRLATSVKVCEKTRRDAIEFLTKAIKMEFTAGKNPIGMASAALYLSCVKNNENVSQAKIAEAAGVTTITLRNRYHVLAKQLGDLKHAEIRKVSA